MGKNIQIDAALYGELVRYHILQQKNVDIERSIYNKLMEKHERMMRHEIYTKARLSKSAKEREEARKQYLDMVGMRDSFRY